MTDLEREILEQSNIPKKYLDLIQSDGFDKNKILKSVSNQAGIKSICLIGGVGIGKSISLVWYALNIMMQDKERMEYYTNVRPKYIQFDELKILWDAYCKGFDRDQREKYFKNRNTKRILFIDDIVTGWDMFNIINFRVNENRITLLASNLSYDDFKDSVGDAVLSRIKGNMSVDFIKADDMRGGN